MSKADKLFVKMCTDILENGFSSQGKTVRSVWEDGTPAHTIKQFGVVNRYDLSEEFPALTLRPTAIKSAVDEVLWIWQKKSNNIKELKSSIWDQWADEEGSIGKAYGYQLGIKYKFPHGEMDQVDNALKSYIELKNIFVIGVLLYRILPMLGYSFLSCFPDLYKIGRAHV